MFSCPYSSVAPLRLRCRCSFTGELNRFAVLRATARDVEGVKRCRDVADGLFAQLMLFDWRNGNLRRKFDAVSGSAL